MSKTFNAKTGNPTWGAFFPEGWRGNYLPWGGMSGLLTGDQNIKNREILKQSKGPKRQKQKHIWWEKASEMSFLYKILPHEQLSDKMREKNNEK